MKLSYAIGAILWFAVVQINGIAGDNPHNIFTIETKDDVSSHYFIEDGKYFFVRADDNLHFFDGENGKEVWTLEVPDFEKKGLHIMWDKKKYIVSNENEELVCYDVYTGKVLWQQKYPDIDQDEYSDYDNTEAGVILYYDDLALCVDFDNGKELWRHEIRFDSNRKEKGLDNFWWTWGEENGDRFLFATKDGMLLLDANTGKELWKKDKDGELSDKEEVEAVTFYGSKALLMYDNDVIGFVDLKKGKELWTRKQDIGDIEGYSTLKDLAGSDYLLISTDDQQFMVNLTTGNMQWETKPDALIGVLTDHKVLDKGKSVLCYFLRRRRTGSETGTYFDLAKLDVTTGKVIYKEKIAFADWAPATGLANFFSKAFLGVKVFNEHDYGFIFSEYVVGDDLVFLIRGTKAAGEMEDPLKRDGDGEGLVRINTKTGKIIYRSYFPLNKVGFRWSAVNFDINAAPQPVVEGDVIYMVGAERVVAANLKTGKVIWKIDDDLGFPADWGIFDKTIYLKVGYQAFDVSVNAKSGSVDAKKSWNKDPYRVYCIDAATGKEIWQIDFKYDPGIAMPDGEVKIDVASRTMIGADEDEMFAVRLTRDGGGKRIWTLKFDDDLKVGDLDHEDCYAVTQSSSSSVSVGYNYTTTTTSYSASAKLVLYPVYRGDHIVVFGPEGVASVGVDGKVLWRTEWNWAGKKVTLPPQFLSTGKIVYMVKEDIQLMDEKTGKLYWKEEDDYDATPIIPPSNKFLYMMEKDEIRVYKMSE